MTYAWEPTVADVGNAIPTKTVNVNLPGEDEYLNTFTTDTRPTATQAQVLIHQAAESVALAVASIPAALNHIAKSAAVWRSAADIELTYPTRNADIDIYEQLNARANLEWDRLLAAASGQGTSTSVRVPQWTMPDPVTWGDTNV